MIKFYNAPITEIEMNGRWVFASKTLLYRVNYSRHTIIERFDNNTACIVRVDAGESEHTAIAADPDIVEINWPQ